MKLKLNLKDKILKPGKWIEKIKENREVFIIIIMFMLLNFIVFLSEVSDLPHYLLGVPQTLINWREILFLIILIILVGILAITGLIRGITKRKKVEDTLREEKKLFNTLMDNISDSIYFKDKKKRFARVNKAKAEHSGETCKEMIGKTDFDFLPKEIARQSFADDNYIMESGKSIVDKIEKIIHLDKTEHWVSTTKVPWYDEEGNIIGTIGITRDITERKQDEKPQQVLYNISKATNSAISLDQLYPLIHQELGSIIDTTNFYIALVDEKEDKVIFSYYVDEKDNNFPFLKLSSNNTPTTHVIRTGQSFLINRKQLNGIIAQEALTPWGSITDKSIWLGVPLKVEDRVIGAIVVQSYTNPELYSEKDIRLLEFVSSQVATAIERKRTEEKIRYLSFHDVLTGLYNRAYFEEELKRYNFPRHYPLSVIMIDINGLKGINDTFGHHEGDKLLQHFASLLNSISRKGDVVARLGGDEFTILLPSTTAAQVHDFHERIKKTCEEDNIKPIYLRPSIALGCVTQKGEYQNTEALLKEVDKRMYQDKNINTCLRANTHRQR